MNIMVFDVPAVSGGALSILEHFYNEYKSDLKNQYIFVVSKPELQDTPNIRVLRYPWIKRSWLHRLFFDNFVAPKLLQKHKIEEILSLQNIIIPHTKIRQTIYIHNSIPFSEYRFSFAKNRVLWLYQNVFNRMLYRSIKRANKVLVQTEWMKKECIKKVKIDEDKIEILPIEFEYTVKKYFSSSKEALSTFFYPASGVALKNHKLIIDACMDLKMNGIVDYRVAFTLKGNENKHILKLYKEVQENCLPVEFIGCISREEVFDYYTKSVLVFPSFIETVGLPLIEAKMHGTPILASDCGFAHEILDGYDKAVFFDPFDSDDLYNKLRDKLI